MKAFVPDDLLKDTEKLREFLDGMVLYDHVFVPPESWGAGAFYSVEELEEIGAISAVRLYARVPPD
jgi:hypothetical protein